MKGRMEPHGTPWSSRMMNLVGGLAGGRFPALEPETLEAAARAETGLDDFGPTDYREALVMLCASANDGDLSTSGRYSLKDAIIRALSMRLLWADARKKHPEPLPLVAPVIVVGIPRSGTTYLHRLLCTDPTAVAVPAWQGQRPLPPVRGPDRRVEQARERIDALRRAAPGIERKHHMDALEPEECMPLFDPSFRSLSWFYGFPVWRYQDWYLSADQAPGYAMYRDFLGHLQSAAPGRRLTMKAPVHTLHLDALWATIPDTKLVQTQRDPATVAGSLCSLWYTLHGATARKVDLHRTGQMVVSLLTMMVERSRRARQMHPEKTVIDVTYRELLDAPVETVMGIYAGHGLPVPDGFEASLRASAAQRKQTKHGRHDYILADFGLTADGVRERVR